MKLLRCLPAFAFTLLVSALSAAELVLPVKFDFGAGKIGPGCTQVLPATIFAAETGFGFEPGAAVSVVDRGGDALSGDFCTGAQPFLFSVALPEGNYRVTVTLGDADGESATTIKAELRRLMLENVKTAHGKSETRSFVVNVRTPKIAPGVEVKLKDRERTTELVNWDEKLTLEFNGPRPCVAAVEIAKADVPTIYLLGDSTVCDQPREPYASWGQMFPRFFKPEVAVANHAQSGESLRSSFGARRLEKVASGLKAGDTVLIQFGHNDEKEKGEGVGAFTTYKASLKQYVDAVRKHGAQAVLITPVHRRTFEKDGKMRNSHGDYPEAVRQVAAEENVPLIDLTVLSGRLYEALGPEKSGALFKPGDGTHHSSYGAYEVARCVVEGLRATKLPLAKSLAGDVPPFDPAHPDPVEIFAVPASPQSTEVTPLGS